MDPWLFPVDPDVGTPDESLPLFNISPNWKSGVTEMLSWLTDINTSEQSYEQRRAVRRYPRRSFEYAFMRETPGRSRMDSFLAALGKREHLIPLWHEQYSLHSAFGLTPMAGWGSDWGQWWGESHPQNKGIVYFPYNESANREYDVGDLVMITTLDLTRFAILYVTSVNIVPDVQQYAIGLTASHDIGPWPRSSRIVPLRVARILDQPGLENVSDRVAEARIRWSLSRPDTRFTPDWGGLIRRWQFRPDRQVSMKVEYSRQDYVNDFEAGVIDVTDPGNRVEITQSMALKFFGRNDTWKFRKFLYASRGKCRSFLLPTYMQDLVPTGSIAGDIVDMVATGFTDYFIGPQAARVFLIFEFNNGDEPIYRRIVDVGAVFNPIPPNVTQVETFFLDEELPVIPKSTIARISFVMPVRFDQDTFEIFHATDNSAAVSSAVVFRSCEITE